MNPKQIIFFSILVFLVVSLLILVVGLRSADPGPGETATSTPGTEERVELPDNLRNLNIEAGDRIESPIVLKGEARLWYFEASFPVSIETKDGEVLAQAPATAQDDWMTEEFVAFEAELSFDPGTATEGYVVYRKDNPSGLPENDEEFRMPVKFDISPKEEMTVDVYFLSNNQGNECNVTVAQDRSIPLTDAPARQALELLIAGPWEHEFDYATVIPADVEINSLTIEDGVAEVDFSEELNEIAGSCAVAGARAQIENTLKQFSTVDEVMISVEGNVDEALQP